MSDKDDKDGMNQALRELLGKVFGDGPYAVLSGHGTKRSVVLAVLGGTVDLVLVVDGEIRYAEPFERIAMAAERLRLPRGN